MNDLFALLDRLAAEHSLSLPAYARLVEGFTPQAAAYAAGLAVAGSVCGTQLQLHTPDVVLKYLLLVVLPVVAVVAGGRFRVISGSRTA